jgi:hypothetical protein
LAYKFFGPFPVEQRIGELAYKLTLPEDARIHPVFHVSQLKPFTPNYSPVFMDLPRPPDLAAQDLQPIQVLERRMRKQGQGYVVQLKIQWSSRPPEEATWEDYEVLCKRYPSAPIWEGASSQEAANVTPVTVVN